MKDRLSADDIDRYLAGEDSSGKVDASLAGSPQASEVFNAVRETVRGWGGGNASFDAKRSLESLGAGPKVHPSVQRRPWLYTVAGIAAAVILVIAITLYKNPFTPNPSPLTIKTYTTGIGQRANVQLPEGSSAILAPATTLTVTGRTADLHGQAVFSVNQNSSEPFVVNASRVKIVVLGTSFGVRAYYEMVTVAVRDGKVSVSGVPLAVGQSAIARAGERPGDSTRVFVTPGADVSSILAWTEGKLLFRGQTLGEVVQDLELNYGAEIDINSSLADRKVILDVGPNDTVAEVLDALAKSLDVKLERSGTKYIITR